MPSNDKPCLLISGFLPVFYCFCLLAIKNCSAHLNVKTKTILFSVLQTSLYLGKFSEINKQFHVKSWLTYRSYSSVCKKSILKVEEFLEQILDLLFEIISPEPFTVLYENMQQKTDKYEDY